MKTTLPVRRAAAFTLVELLTVLAIIAVLAALLLPALSLGRKMARRAQAKTDVAEFVAATKHFHTDYGKFPGFDAGDGKRDLVFGDPDLGADLSNSDLLYTLRALPFGANEAHKLNPRRTPYYTGRVVKDSRKPKSGFVEGAAGDPKNRGVFFDPWGRPYFIVLDTNHDGALDVEKFYRDFTGTGETGTAPRREVGAFSLGEDNKPGREGDRRYRDEKKQEESDDILSWAQ